MEKTSIFTLDSVNWDRLGNMPHFINDWRDLHVGSTDGLIITLNFEIWPVIFLFLALNVFYFSSVVQISLFVYNRLYTFWSFPFPNKDR